jgi:uncharacterized protein
MNRRTLAAFAAASATLAVPNLADAHVTVHPNVIPEGAFAVLNVRVPNETDDADTTKLSVQMPAGVKFASVAPPPGWKAELKTAGEETTQVDFTGGSIPPGQFAEFPISMAVPGKAGDTLAFKALQTYSDGEVVRWIGAPDSDAPASTITISEKGGLIEDSTGEHDASHEEAATPAEATTKVVREEAGNGLAIAALIVGGLGLAAGGAALARKR